MKMIIVVALALVAVACAYEAPINILHSESVQSPEGNYHYGYESEDGTQREETGELKEALDEDGKPHTVLGVRGSYKYTDSEGKVETINYQADEFGYRAEGPSIPQVASRR